MFSTKILIQLYKIYPFQDHPMINDYPENNCITCQNYLEKCSTEKLILAVNSKKEQPSLLCNTNNNLAQSNDVITQTTIDICKSGYESLKTEF